MKGPDRAPPRPVVAAVLAGTLLACGRPVPPAAARRPSVVYWLTIDALRHDTLRASRAGQLLMPRLGVIAGEAVSFDNAYAQSSFTKISVASMFTGLWPQRLGVKHCAIEVHPEGVEPCFGLDSGFTTVAERLERAGWSTIVRPFTVHVRRGDGLLQGFTSQATVREHVPGLGHWFPWRAGAEGLLGGRVFVYHHLGGVHAPYRPSTEARARFRLAQPEAVDPGTATWYNVDLSAEQVRELRASYEALAWDVDSHAANLLDGLKSARAWDDALVVVTADHGEEFLEHGRTQHSSHLYEESIRVPLLVKFPRGSPGERFHGRRIPDRVRLIDVTATIVHLVEGAEDRRLDGRSLIPLLAGDENSRPPRRVLAFTSVMRPFSGAVRLFEQHAVIDSRFKALAGWRADSSQAGLPRGFERGDGVQELYDLAADPDERRNVAPRAMALWLALASLASDVERPGMATGVPTSGPAGTGRRRQLEERLRALGYVE